MEKRKLNLIGLLLGLFCFLVLEGLAQDGTSNRVLIIGIDGCRPDALLAAQTPNMDALLN